LTQRRHRPGPFKWQFRDISFQRLSHLDHLVQLAIQLLLGELFAMVNCTLNSLLPTLRSRQGTISRSDVSI
jgi:hypothetical protein